MRRSALVLVLLLSGCSVLDPTSDGMSAHAANAFAKQVSEAFANSMNGVAPAPPPSTEAMGGPSPVAINIQVTHRTNCTAGGNIQVLGNLTGNISDTGSGLLLLQVTETISDWQCIGDLVINGDPYVSVAGHMSFLNGQLSSPTIFTASGGFKWGTGSKQSCQMSLNILIRADGTGSVTGTVCDEVVNQQF